jgi:hypothetical protein
MLGHWAQRAMPQDGPKMTQDDPHTIRHTCTLLMMTNGANTPYHRQTHGFRHLILSDSLFGCLVVPGAPVVQLILPTALLGKLILPVALWVHLVIEIQSATIQQLIMDEGCNGVKEGAPPQTLADLKKGKDVPGDSGTRTPTPH